MPIGSFFVIMRRPSLRQGSLCFQYTTFARARQGFFRNRGAEKRESAAADGNLSAAAFVGMGYTISSSARTAFRRIIVPVIQWGI